jgi:hypothetical protein
VPRIGNRNTGFFATPGLHSFQKSHPEYPSRVGVDLHAHILPGMDDGAPDLEARIAMGMTAVAEGIETVAIFSRSAE